MTILVADDNALVRSWLKIILQQLEGDRSRILEADDGGEALRICLEEPVDLLITDIKMPGQDGISLIKDLRVRRPGLCAAVLSGYDDFEYVRVALQCGALDYILKAEMKQEDISSLMQKVREKRSLSHGAEYYLNQYQDIIRQAKGAYEDYLRQGPDASQEPFLDVCLPAGTAKGCITMLVLGEHPAGTGERQAASICCGTLKSMGFAGVAFSMDADTYLMIYALDDEAALQERHMRLLSALDQNLTAARMGRLAQNVNLVFSRSDDLLQKLHYAQELIDYQVYYETSALPPAREPGHQEERALLEALQAAVNLQHYDRACELVQDYVSARHGDHVFPSRIRRAVTAAMQVMLSALPFDGGQPESYQRLDRQVLSTGRAQTAAQLNRRLNRFCSFYIGYGNQNYRAASPAVNQAVAYCNEHYARKVTLDELAAHVRLNKTYFSQLFHKEMGVSFGDYLESVRIKRAQQLLRENRASIAEISEQVGFSNQNYFTKVFKRATGTTPSQYRAACFSQLMKGEETGI